MKDKKKNKELLPEQTETNKMAESKETRAELYLSEICFKRRHYAYDCWHRNKDNNLASENYLPRENSPKA